MPINPTPIDITQLLEALLDAFNHDEFSQLLRFKLNTSIEHIAPVGGNLRDIITNVVTHYAAQEKGLKRLLVAALELNPSNTLLKQLGEKWADKEFKPTDFGDDSSLAPAPGEEPYKGLSYFDVADAHLFFGREKLTAELAGRLRKNSFLAVVGASGSGKSSLVRAGLVASLQDNKPLADGRLSPQGSDKWPLVIITPTANPLENLADYLIRDLELTETSADLVDAMSNDYSTLAQIVRAKFNIDSNPDAPKDGNRLLLVVDQFEELFTQSHDAQEHPLQAQQLRQAFIENLLVATQSIGEEASPVVLVITLRADFYSNCAEFTSLRNALETQQRFIGPMSRDELTQVITEPLKQAKWTIDQQLVELILEDIGTEPGGLPLLSHALLITWKLRRGRKMTLFGYLSSGRVQGAIAKTAQALFEKDSRPPDEKRMIRETFIRLTELGREQADTRRLIPLDDLANLGSPEQVQLLVDELISARLVTVNRDLGLASSQPPQPVQATIQVSHEALIRKWGTLQEWIAESRTEEEVRRWLERLAGDNVNLEGANLVRAESWLQDALERQAVVDPEIDELIRRSSRAEEQRVAKQEEALIREGFMRKLWVSVIGFALLALAAGIAAYIAFGAEQKARTSQLAASSFQQRAISSQRGISLALSAVDRTLSDGNSQLFAVADSALRTNFDQWAYWQRNLIRDPQNRPNIQSSDTQTQTIEAIQFGLTPNTIFSGGNDSQLIQWDWQLAEEPLFEAVVLENSIKSMAYNEEHNLLYVGTKNGQVLSLSDTVALQPIDDPLQAYDTSTGIVGLALVPDGEHLFSINFKGELKQWPLSEVGLPIEKGVHTRTVDSTSLGNITVSNDGRWLAVASKDPRMVALWSIDEDGVISDSPYFSYDTTAGVRAVAISADNRWLLASTGGDEWLVWSLDQPDDGPMVQSVGEAVTGLRSMVSHPTENLIATGSEYGEIGLVTLHADNQGLLLAGARLGKLGDHIEIETVAFDPSGQFVASGGTDGSVRMWSLTATNAEPRQIPAPSFLHVQQQMHEAWIRDVDFLKAPDNNPAGSEDLIASVDVDGQLMLWSFGAEMDYMDREIGHVATISQQDAQFRSVALSDDGKWLAAGAYALETPMLWSMAELEQPPLLLSGEHSYPGVLSVAFSPDNNWLATGGGGGVCLRNLRNPVECEVHLKEPLENVFSLAYSNDGRFLVTGDDHGQLIWWDLSAVNSTETNVITKPTYRVINDRDSWIRSVAISQNGEYIAAAYDSPADVVIYKVGDQQVQPLVIGNHGFDAITVTFSPDNNWVASSGTDRVVNLYNLPNIADSFDSPTNFLKSLPGINGTTYNHQPIKLEKHTSTVLAVDFTPDSQFLLSAGEDRRLLLWRVSTGELVRRGCDRIFYALSDEEMARFSVNEPVPTSCLK